jgi:hypothetical protein
MVQVSMPKSCIKNKIISSRLLHDELYRVSPFQVYRTSTSCLPCDLDFLVMSVEIYTNLTQMSGVNGQTNGQTDKVIAI